MTEKTTQASDTDVASPLAHDRAEGAFLGAAIGDALGWPHEMRPQRGRNRFNHTQLKFERWIKRSGGRFQTQEEVIEAGAYSDDTQLILACARSLLRAPQNWWLLFATEELPLWTLYQRGGGGATKRAAASWVAGREPWSVKPDDARRYFDAGGNGVVMRILPHCLRRAGDPDFQPLAIDIMTDGVTTHGHPRALVGALAYGYGLWQAFRHRGTLEYGRLLEVVIENTAIWGSMPSIEQRWSGWHKSASMIRSVEPIWSRTVGEQRELLEIACRALAAGAAAIDEETLEALGCFDRAVNGSGTVNAAAALFLASRHATEPTEGLMQAALAEGADTDTLASMVGGLLGAAVGQEWTRPLARDLQDHDAIRRFAASVSELPLRDGWTSKNKPVTRTALSRFLSRLTELEGIGAVTLPNGIEAEARPWDGVVSKAKSMSVSAWRLKLEDGQTIFAKKLAKTNSSTSIEHRELRGPHRMDEENVSPPIHVGFRLVVSDLSRSVDFYQHVLGLPITKRSAKSVSLGGVLSISEAEHPITPGDQVTIFVEVADLARSRAAYERLTADGDARIEERGDRSRLQFYDPDGYRIELYQIKHSEGR
ncbi:ADP-ribosylglycohydrolase family protein [Bosea beijingensis]